MADKKISELDSQTGAQTADDDVFVIADVSANVTKKITLSELDNALAARDFNFGDNTKLLMGDSNDLEIFHNASDSIINDAGTGSLKLQTGGSTKLEVTSGGVTVTGSVTGSLTGNADTATQVYVTDPDPDTDANHFILGVASTSSGNKAVVLDGGVYFNPSLNRLYSNSIFISGSPTSNGFVGFEGSTSDSFETFLYANDPTADRAIYLPDASGTLTVTGASQNVSFGTLTADGGISVDNITIDGTEIDLSSGDLTLDVAGDIILDAEDNGKVQLHDGGTWYGLLRRDSNDFQLYSIVQDGDMVFRGNDGGSNVTALTLDMSAAGAATFNDAVGVGMAPDSAVKLSVSGAVGPTNGSAGSPTHTFYGDPDTGMFRAAANTLAFSTGGTERMRIKSTGDAGIGTGGDFTYDDITGSGAGLVIGSSSVSSAGIAIRTGTSGTSRIYFADNSGSADARKAGSIEFDHSTDDMTIQAEDDLRLYAKEDVVMRGGTYTFDNADGSSEYARIDSSGNVLVGTTSNNSANAGHGFQPDGFVYHTRDGGAMLRLNRLTSDGDIQQFQKDGNTIGTIGSNTTSGQSLLDIASEADAASNMRFLTSSGSSLSEAMRIDSNGAVTKPLQPAFQVTKNAHQSNLAVNTNHTITFETEIFDQNGDFASNTFTAPVTGRYQLSFHIYLDNVDTATSYYEVQLVTSNTTYFFPFSANSLSQDATFWHVSSSILADMDASDTALMKITLSSGGTAQTDINQVSRFTGFLAC